MYDVVIVGGGAAGLSAALTLGRSRRHVLVVDAGHPRNAPAAAMHGFLSRDGMSPLELLAVGRDEVARYGVEIVDGVVTAADATADGFSIELGDGSRYETRRLLVTTGLVDELPDIAGVRELWGRDVLHCPYCHGWEVRDQPVGVLGNGPRAVHVALLFRQLTDDVVFFTHTTPPAAEERALLGAIGVQMVDGRVTSLDVADGRLAAVCLEDGTVVPRRALVVGTRSTVANPLLASLGVEAVEHPSGVGAYVPTDAMGLTAVPNVWAAGNVTDPSANVIIAAAAGFKTGAAVNADLAMDDARRALQVELGVASTSYRS